jgi:type IV secretory pathway component VirB8
MTDTSIAQEARWAQQERVHAAEKRASNRTFIKNCLAMLFLLAAAVTVATLLAARLS